MNDPIAQLKEDHREVETLLKTLASSKPGARRRSTVAKVEDKLAKHMRIEERLVYPLIPSVLGDEAAEEANVEHGLARKGLAELKRLQDEPGFGASVDMLTAGIKHHVKEEEQPDGMFAEAKKSKKMDLVELGRELAMRKQELMANTNR